MKEDLVSVLIANFNTEKYIEECINSFINQTYKNIEIIVVDDCSTDNSVNIVKDLASKDDRIKLIIKDSHTCTSDVRNVGIDNARGDFIMFVDSDDWVEPNYVELMHNTIVEKNVDLVKCKNFQYRSDGSYYSMGFFDIPDKVFYKKDFGELVEPMVRLSDGISPCSWGLIIRKSALKVRFDNKVTYSQDRAFIFNLVYESIESIYFLPELLYHYRYVYNSSSNDTAKFYKYVDSFLLSILESKRILQKHNYLNEHVLDLMGRMFLEYTLVKLYKQKSKSIAEIYKMLKHSFTKKESIEIINQIKYTNSDPLKYRVRYYLIKHQMFRLLSVLIWIRK